MWGAASSWRVRLFVFGEGGSYQRWADARDHFFLWDFYYRGEGEEVFGIG